MRLFGLSSSMTVGLLAVLAWYLFVRKPKSEVIVTAGPPTFYFKDGSLNVEKTAAAVAEWNKA